MLKFTAKYLAIPIFSLFIYAQQSQSFTEGCDNCHIKGDKILNAMNDGKLFLSHVSSNDIQCSNCHINLGLAKPFGKSSDIPFSQRILKSLFDSKLYFDTPDLRYSFLDVPRYTFNGLTQFLNNPVSRYFDSTSTMYPLNADQLNLIKNDMQTNTETIPDFIVDKNTNSQNFKHGKKLFNDLGCETCHSNNAITPNTPRLRIGIPLISYSYFKKRLSLGASNKTSYHRNQWIKNNTMWSEDKSSTKHIRSMPQYNLNEADNQNLFTYISLDNSDLEKRKSEKSRTIPLGGDLFKQVQNDIFDGACKHCHSGSTNTRDTTTKLFSTTNELAFFPQSAVNVNSLNEHSLAVLQSGKNCEDSEIVARLKDRHLEWYGYKNHPDRGMPLTLPPIPYPQIEVLSFWSKTGCPTPTGNLCEKCY